MQHLDEGTIHAWLDGALSPDEAARVEAHVAECPQCAAAVAEARGFIAASSRILTALDHVPRGVVPVARPARWSNPAMWRAAAAVLVIAAGSLVVVRNTGRDSKAEYTSIETTDTAPVIPFAPPITILAKPSLGAAGSAVQQSVSPAQKSVEKRVATDAAAPAEQTLATTRSRVAESGNAAALSSRPNILANDNSVAATPTAPAVSDSAGKNSPASGYGSVQPLQSRIMLRGMTALSTDRDSIGVLGPLKVVGTPRQIGAKVTLYEVTPTDTVTLTEFMSVQLGSVVVTGMAAPTTQRIEGQAAGKAAAAPSPQRVDAAVAGRQDSQREAGGVAGAEQARARSVPAPVTAVGTANGVTTVTWTDGASGNVLKLSGRLPLAQLQQIKIRIERERAAAAAAAKKNP
jgi:anti-sigma factor RsiW